MRDSRDGTVFVGEHFDDEKPHRLTARFHAHLERPDRTFLDGPEDVSADEAIAWGRAHADVVLIRLGDSDVHWSAGAVRPEPDEEDGEDFPVWPDGRLVEPRYLPGMEHLGIQTEEPIDWTVRLPRRVARRRAEEEAEAMGAALAADPVASEVEVELRRERRRADAVFSFVVSARSHAEAFQAVLDLEERLLDRFPYPVEELPRRQRRGGFFFGDGWDHTDAIRPRDA